VDPDKPGCPRNDRTHHDRRTPQPLTPNLDNGPGSDKQHSQPVLLLIVPGERGRQPSTHARCPTNAGADIGAGRLPGGRPALVLTCGPERVARIRRGERSGARPPRGFLIGRISGMGHSRTCRQGAVAAIVRRRRWCARSGEAVAELLTGTTARCLRPSRDLAAALAREAVCFGGGLSRDSGQHPRCRLRIALGRRRWAACRRRVSRQRAGIA
jgi:hypothetical protein